MNPLLAATQPCFGAISQIRQLEPSALAAPELLQQRLRGFVDELKARLAAARLANEDIEDIAYAVVALADETLVNVGEPVSGFWQSHLLQFHYFRENVAGDGFFLRLQAIRAGRGRQLALQVYCQCLLLGFQGKYRVRGAELELLTLIEAVQREAFTEELDRLSPHGDRPPPALAEARRNLPLLIAAGAALALAFLVYAGERLFLSSRLSAVAAEVAAAPRP